MQTKLGGNYDFGRGRQGRGRCSSCTSCNAGSIEERIASKYFVTGDNAIASYGESDEFGDFEPDDPRTDITPLRILTLCFLVTNNGFTVIGKSAPASPANFDADLGKKSAYEDVAGAADGVLTAPLMSDRASDNRTGGGGLRASLRSAGSMGWRFRPGRRSLWCPPR